MLISVQSEFHFNATDSRGLFNCKLFQLGRAHDGRALRSPDCSNRSDFIGTGLNRLVCMQRHWDDFEKEEENE